MICPNAALFCSSTCLLYISLNSHPTFFFLCALFVFFHVAESWWWRVYKLLHITLLISFSLCSTWHYFHLLSFQFFLFVPLFCVCKLI